MRNLRRSPERVKVKFSDGFSINSWPTTPKNGATTSGSHTANEANVSPRKTAKLTMPPQVTENAFNLRSRGRAVEMDVLPFTVLLFPDASFFESR